MNNYSLKVISMGKRKTRRNRQEKIDLIYKTFFNLVLELGYDRTSTNHVAKEAQISIGTIYRYFPNGKTDIILKYFENTKDIILNMDSFMGFSEKTMLEVFKTFISSDIENQRSNLGYRIAFNHAIQANKKLLEAYQDKIISICEGMVHKLQTSNELFKLIPTERLIKRFVFIYNFISANIYHHLVIMKLFDTDEELIKYLSTLLVFTIKSSMNPRILKDFS